MNKFSEYFGRFIDMHGIPEELQESNVLNVKIDSENRSIEITAEIAAVLDKQQLYAVENKICESVLTLYQCRIHPKYDPEFFDEKYYPELKKELKRRYASLNGTLNDSELIMGVNDLSQIKNEKLANDPGAQAMLIKTETTINRGDLLDERCENIMRNADMYCIFGLSLGETDKKWWDILAARMNSSNAHILYYAFTQRDIIHNQDLWDI